MARDFCDANSLIAQWKGFKGNFSGFSHGQLQNDIKNGHQKDLSL
jgi:hypothetical protein